MQKGDAYSVFSVDEPKGKADATLILLGMVGPLCIGSGGARVMRDWRDWLDSTGFNSTASYRGTVGPTVG